MCSSDLPVFGTYGLGRVRITLLPEHLPSFHDRFTAKEAVAVYTEVRTRTASAVERPRYPVVIRTFDVGAVGDRSTKVSKTIGVLHCRKADANGSIVAGELVEGTDFTVDGSGQIDWTLGDGLGSAPAAGERYALQYYVRPRWVVENIPYVHRNTLVLSKTPKPEVSELMALADCRLEWLGDGG